MSDRDHTTARGLMNYLAQYGDSPALVQLPDLSLARIVGVELRTTENLNEPGRIASRVVLKTVREPSP